MWVTRSPFETQSDQDRGGDVTWPSAGAVATLVAVNVGLPVDVPWKDSTVHTGIWKRPVEGRRMVRRLNIDGDGQGDLAGHGGEHRAVLVYQLDSYRYWEAHLGRYDLTHGAFGENFTVDGLADDEVRVGDRYRIGGAVFEVSQPRVTCYRVGIRLDEPRMPALLVSHRRPGFYMRVLTEGPVQAGDAIVKVASGPEGITIADVDALLYLPRHPRDDLVRALRVDALSPGWKASLAALLRAGRRRAARPPAIRVSPRAGPPPAWDGFRPLRVTGSIVRAATVTSVWLAAPDGRALPRRFRGSTSPSGWARLGRRRSFATTRCRGRRRPGLPHQREARAARRGQRPHPRLGAGGADHRVAAPRGTFTLAGRGPVALVSAGVGVTPVLAMLHALAADSSRAPVYWVHGARNGSEYAFAAEVRRLLATLPGARWSICYSSPVAGRRARRSTRPTGRVTAPSWSGSGSRSTPTCTSAVPPRSWPTSRRRSARSGSPRRACTPRCSARSVPAPRHRRQPAALPGSPTALRERGRRSRSPAAGSRLAGTIATARCSSWPRRVASRSAGRAGRACATRARRSRVGRRGLRARARRPAGARERARLLRTAPRRRRRRSVGADTHLGRSDGVVRLLAG